MKSSEISEAKFNIMVDELLNNDTVSYDMLYEIANEILFDKIRYWCQTDVILKDRDIEDDIFQMVYIKLQKSTIAGFLLRDVDGPVNLDRRGFAAWMVTIAKNTKSDVSREIRRREAKCTELDDKLPLPVEDDYISISDENVEKLRRAFAIVIEADYKIAKKLTWIAMSLIMLREQRSNAPYAEIMEKKFSAMTLYDMYNLIKAWSKNIPWLEINAEQDKLITDELNTLYSGKRRLGELQYGEFAMSKGMRATISDWQNKINGSLIHIYYPDGNGSNTKSTRKETGETDGKKKDEEK